MTDSRYDEESLPWLQPVEDEDGPRGISAKAMLLGLLAALVVAAVVAAAFFWIGSRDGGLAGEPELIRAPDTPYKVKPENPGGLDIAGESQATFETSAGKDVDSRLNLGATGREDVATVPTKDIAQESEAAATPPVEKPAPPPPKPKPSGAAGTVIQLGAFRNTAQAERAWTALTTRFPGLTAMTKIVVPYSVNGSSGYRLRAAAPSSDSARETCEVIHAGGESCFIAR